jgi:hypothetical protein
MNRVPKLSKLRRLFRAPATETTVHFHRGPQGQPSPCYDSACPMPHLTVE